MPTFGTKSKENLLQAHPLLQKLFNEVIKEIDCTVLDAQRGRAAQEKAFKAGRSRAHFGQSAHNYSPAVALDVVPFPLDWNDTASFRKLAAVVKRLAAQMNIPIEWGGDWKSLVDMPHYELKPWRIWAAKSSLIGATPGKSRPVSLIGTKEIEVEQSAVVDVKSAWVSKVNWTMALGVVFNVLALFGLNVPEDVRVQIMTLGNSLLFVAGWAIRTFFTTSVTQASAKKL